MEAMQAKMERAALTAEEATLRAEQAAADLVAQQKEAERALQAYAATAREMARLGSPP
jgi:hypothetical protein